MPGGRPKGDPNHQRRGNGGFGGSANGAGNHGPGPGRPKGMKSGEGKRARSADLCAPMVSDAVEVWREVMNDPNAPAAARIVAAEKVISRAEGATPQRIEVKDTRDLERLSDAELAAIARGGAVDAAPEGDQAGPDGVVH